MKLAWIKFLQKYIIVLFLVDQIAANQRFKRQSAECGVPKKDDVGLIINGESFERGSWPWMVAMFETKGSENSSVLEH